MSKLSAVYQPYHKRRIEVCWKTQELDAVQSVCFFTPDRRLV